MTSEFLPFALPDIGDEEIEAAVDALRSGWLSTGPRVHAFEEDFTEFLGGGVHAVALNSATAGLHLALEALGIGPGDEVLVPTWTFTATAEVVRYVGAEPVLVDVDPGTLNLDLDAAEAQVTSRTRAIIPVHFAGLPVPRADLDRFAARHGLAVVEDAAHALPSASDGVAVGKGASDATIFSFYATKTVTTGEGGMLVTRRDDIAQRARVMRLHGISRDAFDRYRSQLPAWRYEVIAPGFKYNLTDPAAAIGRVQLKRIWQMRERRAAIADNYAAQLKDLPVDLPADVRGEDIHSWHLFVIRLRADSPVGRDNFIDRMAEFGVTCSVHFIPLHMHPYWRERYGLEDAAFPVATSAFEHVVSLPLYSRMSDADVDLVVEAAKRALT